ncbi:Hint domain-containing protein [Ascidiaceihabitans sp.]|uniref:Hint domain-containing protein n=1 Tax=Ascidiaceihabitans sp. TaxID=1872644 RepID=UPI0032979893
MAIGYLVSLGNSILDAGDAISGSQSTFTTSDTIGTGSWTWSGIWDGDGQNYDNVTDSGTYQYATDGNVYFVPDNWYTASGTASAAATPSNITSGTSGDDTITGTSGDEVIYGGDGNDYLTGRAGDDLIFGGEGNDNYDTDTGDDTFYGEGGDDWVAVYYNMDGETLFGGETDETFGDLLEVYGDFAGVDASITLTGDGDGTVTFGGETANFSEFERFYLHSGDDTFDGTAATSDLSVTTSTGDNLIVGGAGDDVLSGGSGEDTIEGGAGSDSINLGGDSDRDTVVTTNFSGSDVIYNFDLTDSGDGTTIDQLDVSGLIDGAGDPVNAWDVVVTDTNGDGTGDAILTFPNGESITLQGVLASQVDSAPELNAMGIPCFTAGTQIATPMGDIAVEDLSVGDLVATVEYGPRPVRWITNSDLGDQSGPLSDNVMPVRIKPGTMGNSRPLVVSPQHCILMTDAQTGENIYVKAKHLAEETCMASFARGLKRVTYVHVLLGQHATLISNDIPSESFYPGPMAIKMLSILKRAKLYSLVPDLTRKPVKEAYGPRAALILTRKEVRTRAASRKLAKYSANFRAA